MIQSKSFICADDFGYNDCCCQAILSAIRKHTVSAVSVLVNPPFLVKTQHYAEQFIQASKKHTISIGIHLNLTEGKPSCNGEISLKSIAPKGVFDPLFYLLLRCFLSKIAYTEVLLEFQNQVETFTRIFGTPAFFNSHQHIHLFPVFSKALKTISERQNGYIRTAKTVKHYLRSKSPLYAFVFELLCTIFRIGKIAGDNNSEEVIVHPGTTFDRPSFENLMYFLKNKNYE